MARLIAGLDVIYGLSLLLVLVPAVGGFYPSTLVFPVLNNPAFPIRSGMLGPLNISERLNRFGRLVTTPCAIELNNYDCD